MTTPPTRVQLVQPAVGFLSTATPKTTPAFDVQNGDLLVVVGQYENALVPSGTGPAPVPTWTGTGTWTQRAVSGTLGTGTSPGNHGLVVIWTCAVTATATGVTVSLATTNSVNMYGFTVTQWRGHSGHGATAIASVDSPTTGTATASLTTSAANSAVQMGDNDWTAQDGTTRVFSTVNGSAMTESLYARNTINYACYGAYSPDAGAAGSKSIGVTTPGGQTYAVAGIEILGLAGSEVLTGILLTESGQPLLTESGHPILI
jgi:hypothetical protein